MQWLQLKHGGKLCMLAMMIFQGVSMPALVMCLLNPYVLLQM